MAAVEVPARLRRGHDKRKIGRRRYDRPRRVGASAYIAKKMKLETAGRTVHHIFCRKLRTHGIASF